VKVMALLQECMGAKGFESDTYFEMALRDVPLIPGLEGSMHINIGLALQFIGRYFNRPETTLTDPPSVVAGQVPSRENEYLMTAQTGAFHSVGFPHFLDAYRPLQSYRNVAIFAEQIDVFQQLHKENSEAAPTSDSQISMAFGQCFATIAYGQLVAE